MISSFPSRAVDFFVDVLQMKPKGTRSSSSAAGGGKAKATAGSAGDEDEVDLLLAAARVSLDQLDPEGALAACQRAVELDPKSVAALDALAEACLACGEPEEAEAALRASVELCPEGGAGRYMYLGQLSADSDDAGAAALGWFTKGVTRLRQARAALDGASGSREELHAAWVEATNALAVGLCSVAEIYLTDACEESEAEQRCAPVGFRRSALTDH